MVQLRSDLARQQELMNASFNAKREGAFHHPSPLYERLAKMQEKEARRRKRGIPWLTIIMVASVIPFLFGGDGDVQKMASVIKGGGLAPEQQMNSMMSGSDGQETATVSVTIGGKTVSKEISVSDMQKMQMMSGSMN